MRAKTVTCNECGKQKGAVNHWYTLDIFPGGEFLAGPFLNFLGDDEIERAVDVCGQECATKAFQRWMATGDIKKVGPIPPPPDCSLNAFMRDVFGGGSNE